ncbi:uncharacterized protein LAJ45_11008 [Morchella importuna]|uniref:Polyprenal reductase n=1 Tax=Morchella conica CCBAS932 TaxID=1392247 RepID=A0A3N4LBF6_9PEZI|nr:uncharacterized protein LAJ45_11008 [Morchella importuna]KAH8144988.1 hypothetical protein LAJ45_11008 [Morchella importuna]RPB15335.1 hypothetical protein P167DRAFT_501842 [Morchella conica CCBAS932]
MDPITVIRYAFLFNSAAIIVAKYTPALSRRFIAYGVSAEPIPEGYKEKRPPPSDTPVSQFLDAAAETKTPHSWFTHFYYVCFACNLFWAWQIVTHGSVYQLLSSYITPAAAAGVSENGRKEVVGQTIHQVVLTWLCFMIQASRRIYECLYIQKPGASKMWVGHYAIGIWFYLTMSIAIWIEGTAAINKFNFTPMNLYNLVGPPSLKSLFGIILFLLGSGIQHDTHVYLATLKKYTLPTGPFFDSLLCPHYAAECLIYLALSLLSAPRGVGMPVNGTVLAGLVFVVVNLGCSSLSTREWYIQKFGRHSVEHRYNMIPWLF